jgi:protein ImuA
MISESPSLAVLRRELAETALRAGPAEAGRVSFGVACLDEPLGGGIARAALHEIQAAGPADLAAATGFVLGLASLAAGARPILWVRQDMLDGETGRPHPPGLAEFGIDPARVLLVRARDAQGVLRAGAEAARCAALGAAVIEPWGAPRLVDLTASRRLALAAEASGVITLLLRTAAIHDPSAARTRWRVAALPSQALEANAPGDPAFEIRLLRHRGGLDGREWRVEWSRDRRSFQESAFQADTFHDRTSSDAAPLSCSLVPFPADRPAAAAGADSGVRRAG